MKLYTKEMFLIAAEKCEVSMIDAKHIMKYIDEYVTPIEIPSHKEIVDMSQEEPDDSGLSPSEEFQRGAKFVINKILQHGME